MSATEQAIRPSHAETRSPEKWEEDLRRYQENLRSKKQQREQLRRALQARQPTEAQYLKKPEEKPKLQGVLQPEVAPKRQPEEKRETAIEEQPTPPQGLQARRVEERKPQLEEKHVGIEEQPIQPQPRMEERKLPQPERFQQVQPQPEMYEELKKREEPRDISGIKVQLSEWVPIKNYSLTEDIGIETPKNIGKFPIEPEQFFPLVEEEIHLSPENEAALIQRIGVKSGIHLQAISRDLNRLTQLVEGSLLRPYRRESILCLVDLLDELDKMDEQIKVVLINLTRDLKERGTLIQDMLKEEQEDRTREAEALNRSRVEHDVVEKVLKPKLTSEQIPEQKQPEQKLPEFTAQEKLEERQPRVSPSEKLQEQPRVSPSEKLQEQPRVSPLEKLQEQPQVSTPALEKSGEIPSITPQKLEPERTTPETVEPVKQPTQMLETPVQSAMPDENKWKSVKFHPFFDVQDNPDAIVMTSYIPGMKKEDLHLDIGQEHFKIEGFRRPSKTDEEELQKEAQGIQQSKPGQFETGNLGDLILMAGAGKFGSFSEQYKLPSNVDRNQIRANYEKDFLQIQCPKQSTTTQAAF